MRFFVLFLLLLPACTLHLACAADQDTVGSTVGSTVALVGANSGLEVDGATAGKAGQPPPNVVIIFLDDSGWSDFQPFGENSYQTLHVEQLAREGCRFNNFYVPQAVCSASRAALLTGCYPGRTQMFGAIAPRVRGLDPKFLTLAEILKPQGYATGCFGKWHLGDYPETRPPARGFDQSCGLMYSHDMWEFHPTDPEFWGEHPLQFWENNKVTIESVTKEHQSQLTKWYTEHAVDFIHQHKDEPFFLYVPHSMPHVPLFCSEKFKGKSGAGLYGDVIMEIDWSVGQITEALRAAGVEENTIVVFTSDNGPWTLYGNHAGKTPFRGTKGSGMDGGIRSACIVKYPREIAADTLSTKAFCTIDLFPTIAHLAGASLPDYPIDGKDVWPLITGEPNAENPHAYYPFSSSEVFEGVVSGDGRWKLHLPHTMNVPIPGKDGQPGRYAREKIEMSLFDLENDPVEQTNVIESYPEVASRLKKLAFEHRETFYPEQP